MREMTRRELRETQIDILDVVHNFCIERNIPYWLDSGTLLGAIRHNGYIPWDDDIDIGMLWPDYERFMEAFADFSPKYQAIDIRNFPSFHCPFAKVINKETRLVELGHELFVNIDIFVYDNAPDDPIKLKEMYDVRDHLRYLYESRGVKTVVGENALKRAAKRVRNIIIGYLPNAYYINKMISNAKQYADVNTECVGDFLAYDRILCSKSIFDSFIDVTFEGKQYKAPVGYDEWLRAFYNEYMELPPVEKRISHHSFIAYIND